MECQVKKFCQTRRRSALAARRGCLTDARLPGLLQLLAGFPERTFSAEQTHRKLSVSSSKLLEKFGVDRLCRGCIKLPCLLWTSTCWCGDLRSFKLQRPSPEHEPSLGCTWMCFLSFVYVYKTAYSALRLSSWPWCSCTSAT